MAYVHALAGRAGLNLGARTNFDYGIDGSFHPLKKLGSRIVPTGFQVDFQMKATTNWRHEDEHVVYDLDARAHVILTDRERGSTFAILILLCLPEDSALWLDGCEDYLRLKNCCYWYRPPGPPTANLSTITIRVPRANVLTPESLQEIMGFARAEGMTGP